MLATALLERVNALLLEVEADENEARFVNTIQDLQRGSVFVYLFETITKQQLSKVNRYPGTRQDFAYNLNLVLLALSDMFAMDLRISASAIVSGDLSNMDRLIKVFESLVFGNEPTTTMANEEEEDSSFASSIFGDISDSLSGYSSSSSLTQDSEEYLPPSPLPLPRAVPAQPNASRWSDKVERIRCERERVDLERAAESRRLAQQDIKERMQREALRRALLVEKERLAEERRLARERREQRQRAQLARLEAAKQVELNRRNLVMEENLQRAAEPSPRAQQLCARTWNEDFTKYAEETKGKLAALRERLLRVNESL